MLSRKITRATLALCVFSIAALGFIGCGNNTGGEVRLQGAGASFPNPLYQKWLSEYGKLNANIKIDYQSIGSGGGIKQIQARTVDFGASDAPMKDEDLKAAPGEILHIPTVLGAVVITYNLADVSQPLRFTPDVIADIFLGKIKKWSDPKIKADNSGVSFPNSDITVVHRSDSSGTSAVFTDYLSKVSPEWKEKVGSGASPNWPAKAVRSSAPSRPPRCCSVRTPSTCSTIPTSVSSLARRSNSPRSYGICTSTGSCGPTSNRSTSASAIMYPVTSRRWADRPRGRRCFR